MIQTTENKDIFVPGQGKNPLHIPEKLLLPLRESPDVKSFAPAKTDKKKSWNTKNIRIHPESEKIEGQIYKLIDLFKKKSGDSKIDHLESLPFDKNESISPGAIREIFESIMAFERPSEIFIELEKKSLLKWILPELSLAHEVGQNIYHKYDVFYHSIYSCDYVPTSEPLVRIAALFHDLGKVPAKREINGNITFYNHELISTRICGRFLKKIQYPKTESLKILRLVRNHMFHYTPQWTESAVRRFYCSIGHSLINDLLTLRLADRKANGIRTGIPDALFKLKERLIKLLEKDQKFCTRDLKITGKDLIDLFKLKPGPQFGIILNELTDKIIKGGIPNDREILLKEVRKIISR